jgi:hypothetical protein
MPDFTPGPWKSKRHDGTGRVMEFKREFWEVGGGPERAGVAFVFKGQANADLIAAAPRLYGVLRRIVSEVVPNCGCFVDMLEEIADALDQADGVDTKLKERV